MLLAHNQHTSHKQHTTHTTHTHTQHTHQFRAALMNCWGPKVASMVSLVPCVCVCVCEEEKTLQRRNGRWEEETLQRGMDGRLQGGTSVCGGYGGVWAARARDTIIFPDAARLLIVTVAPTARALSPRYLYLELWLVLPYTHTHTHKLLDTLPHTSTHTLSSSEQMQHSENPHSHV